MPQSSKYSHNDNPITAFLEVAGGEFVCALNDEQMEGGSWLDGLCDASALESALARPKNLAAYENPDVMALAAAYAFGISRNHPFVDGNKRVVWVSTRVFLENNGLPASFQ